MSRTVLATMLALGLVACSSVGAKEPKPGDGALDGTLVAGTLLEATIAGSRSRRFYLPGEMLTATVSADVTNAVRWVVIPAGSPVGLRVAHWGPATSESPAAATITLELHSVTVWGRLYPVRAAAALTAVTIYPPGGEVMVVAPATRILFVLSEGFTATMPRALLPDDRK